MFARLTTAALFLSLPTGSTFAAPKHAAPSFPASKLPQLSDPIPAGILKARTGNRTCETGERHRDPCATIHIRRDIITVAWDETTRRVTFLSSTTLRTDDEIVAGGLGRIDASMSIQPFLGGFVSPDWCDTDASLSGDALWCALMKPAPKRYGRVLALVQSIYLPFLPDTDEPTFIRTGMIKASPCRIHRGAA